MEKEMQNGRNERTLEPFLYTCLRKVVEQGCKCYICGMWEDCVC